jgi:tetratricopeptide (TPR) repeat protein
MSSFTFFFEIIVLKYIKYYQKILQQNKFLLKILIITFLFIIGMANAATFTKEEMDAQMLYLKAVSNSGKEEDLEKAMKSYEDLFEVSPKIEYELRIASLTALKAKFFFMPNKKTEMANKSIRYFADLEEKIAGSKDKNLIYEFHLYRGRTFIEFPGMFKKKEIAINDLKTATESLEKLNRPSLEKGGLFLAYAKALKDEGKKEEVKLFVAKALAEELSEEEIKEAKSI